MTIKKILTILGAVAAITILGLGVYHSDASQKSNLLSEEEITDLITSQYPGEITKMELNQDANESMYEVTIKGDQAEYELLMDAESGKVLKLKETRSLADSQTSSNDKREATAKDQNKPEKKLKDKKNSAKNESASKTGQDDAKKSNQKSNDQNSENKTAEKQNKKPAKEKKTAISRDEAVKIALEQFSGEVDDVDLEEENGRLVYEIEIERGDMEAEILIDAYTGEVLIMEIDD